MKTARDLAIALEGATITRLDIVPRQPDAQFPAELILVVSDGRTLMAIIDDGYRVYDKSGGFKGLWKNERSATARKEP